MPYVRCPACGKKNYVSASFSGAYYRFGLYYKSVECKRCYHVYEVTLYELTVEEERAGDMSPWWET